MRSSRGSSGDGRSGSANRKGPTVEYPLGRPFATRPLGAINSVVGPCHASPDLADGWVEEDCVVDCVGPCSRRGRQLSALRIRGEFGDLVPVTDADVVAARKEREDYLLRDGFFTAVTGSFLLAAVPEEILFRSGALAVQRWRPSNPILILSAASVMLVLFAVWHASFGVGNVVFSFVGGALFTALALYTRSLWPAIVAHGVGNLISVTQLILTS